MMRQIVETIPYESLGGSYTWVRLECRLCGSLESKTLSRTQIMLDSNWRSKLVSICSCDLVPVQHRVRCRIAGAIQRSYRGRMSK